MNLFKLPSKKNNLFYLFFLFIIAFFVRTIFFHLNFDIFINFTGDELDYLKYTSNLLNYNEFSAVFGEKKFYSTRDPFLIFYFFFISKIFGFNILFLHYSIILISSLNICIIWFLLKNIKLNHHFSLFVLLILIFYPPSLFFSSHLLTESLSSLFISLIFLFVVICSKKNSLKSYLFLGFLLGILALTKSFFLFLIFFILPLLIYKKKNNLSKINFINFFFLILVFIFTISPWVIRNTFLHEDFTLINTRFGQGLYICNGNLDSPNIIKGLYDGEIRLDINYLSETNIDKIYFDKTIVHIRDNFYNYLTKPIIFNRIKNLLHFKQSVGDFSLDYKDIIMFLIWVPIILIYFLSIVKIKNRFYLFSWIFFLYFVLMTIPFWGTPRFRYPFDQIIIITSLKYIYDLFLYKSFKLRNL